MRYAAMILAVLGAACSGATGPKGIDPTVLASNVATDPLDSLRLTWYDQSGQVSTTVLAPGVRVCVHFTSTLPADSVRFVASMGPVGVPGTIWSQATSPWFDPRTGVGPDPTQYPFGAEFWTAVGNGAALGITMQAVPAAPC